MATVNIHGKEYTPVADRVKNAHAELDNLSITTEVIAHSPVVIKATVVTPKGTFSGISSVDTQSAKMIERENPYEVAETSAVGRALGFAGYGVTDSIASADEMRKSTSVPKYTPPVKEAETNTEINREILRLLRSKGHTLRELLVKYEVSSLAELTTEQADTIVTNLQKLPDKKKEVVYN